MVGYQAAGALPSAASRGIRSGTLKAKRSEGDKSLKAASTHKVRLIVLWTLLPLLLILLAGCGGRAAMGWSAPVVEDDVLYVAPKTGKVYALDVNTREPLWAFPAEQPLAGIYSTPVVTQGLLLFGSYEIQMTSFLIFQTQDIQGRAYALDAATGQQRWQFPVGSGQSTEPFLGTPAVGQGMAYFTSSDRKVYALDMETGIKRWEFETGKEIWGGPAWHDGTLYVGSSDKNLYALDAASGERKWAFAAGGAIYGTPHVTGDTLYFGSLDNRVYAVSSGKGEQKWSFLTGNWVWAEPRLYEDTLYVASLDHFLYALDATNGALRWEFDAGDMINASPVVSDGVVYLTAANAGVYALEAPTGTPLWHYPEEGNLRVLSSPEVSDGLLYVNADDGKLYVLDAATGQLRAETAPEPQ